MNFINMLFKTSPYQSPTPLQKRRNIPHELQIQSVYLLEAGHEILEVINISSNVLILYRKLDEEKPKHKQSSILLRLRIITKKGRLYPEPLLNASFNVDFTEIELNDIDIKEHLVNGGYGSILLNGLKQIAMDREITTINGWISEVDLGHIERLVHFYEKHDFEVALQNNDNPLKIGTLFWSNNLIK